MTSFLQTLAIFISLGLVLAWTNLDMKWYHWVFITMAMILYGLKTGREVAKYVRRTNAHLTAEEFDKWLESHNINPHEYAKEHRNGRE